MSHIHYELSNKDGSLSGFRERDGSQPVNAQIFEIAGEMLKDRILLTAHWMSLEGVEANFARLQQELLDFATARRIIRDGKRLDHWYTGNYEIVIDFPRSGGYLKFSLKDVTKLENESLAYSLGLEAGRIGEFADWNVAMDVALRRSPDLDAAYTANPGLVTDEFLGGYEDGEAQAAIEDEIENGKE